MRISDGYWKRKVNVEVLVCNFFTKTECVPNQNKSNPHLYFCSLQKINFQSSFTIHTHENPYLFINNILKYLHFSSQNERKNKNSIFNFYNKKQTEVL